VSLNIQRVCVTLRTGEIAAKTKQKNDFAITGLNYILKRIEIESSYFNWQ